MMMIDYFVCPEARVDPGFPRGVAGAATHVAGVAASPVPSFLHSPKCKQTAQRKPLGTFKNP